MKRYLLFLCARYYPKGGFDDFHGDFDTIEEAKAYAHSQLIALGFDDASIADTQTKKTILWATGDFQEDKYIWRDYEC